MPGPVKILPLQFCRLSRQKSIGPFSRNNKRMLHSKTSGAATTKRTVHRNESSNCARASMPRTQGTLFNQLDY
jgi:hypothetical protein